MAFSATKFLGGAGIVGSAIAWSFSAAVTAWTYQREQQHREWIRMGVITEILYEQSNGAWEQTAAAHELGSLTYNKDAALHVAGAVRQYWQQSAASEQLRALEMSIEKLEKENFIEIILKKLGY